MADVATSVPRRAWITRIGTPLRIGVLLLGFAAPLTAIAQDDAAAVLERRVKAALLYRFANYVDWQDASQPKADAPFLIAIAGADALAAELAEVAANRTVNNRPLAVRKVRATDIPKDAQIVFIGRGESSQLGTVIRAIPPNVLVVTESGDGIQQGAIINFVIVGGQVRFEVSLDAARRRNIHVSSRLLSVAHNVLGALP